MILGCPHCGRAIFRVIEEEAKPDGGCPKCGGPGENIATHDTGPTDDNLQCRAGCGTYRYDE